MSHPDRVRVLIVDDSALMRKLLAELLGASPRVEVIGAARDGPEALAMAERLRPDVVTLDVEMPGMSGLEVLPLLMATAPIPVVMVSSWTQAGAEVTLEALERGAVDFLPKPDRHQFAELRAARDLLVSKVVTAARSRVHRPRPPRPDPPVPPATARRADGPPPARCVAIGISTGGPQTLAETLCGLGPPVPPVLIVQHMPARFTEVFAQRLDRCCPLPVSQAEDGRRVEADRVLIAPGGRHLTLIGCPPHVRTRLTDDPTVSGHRPSVDVLFRSVAAAYGAGAVGVLMTGMGRDGVEGCRAILDAGGRTFGQDEASSIVYGMNKAAQDEGVVGRQFAADELPTLIRGLAT